METLWDKKAREIDESGAKTLTAHIPISYKVAVLAHDDTRESGLIRQFCTVGSSAPCDPFERSFRRAIVVGSQKCVIDLGEVESPNPDNVAEFNQWVRSADGLLLVYNIASNQSFSWMRVLFELVRRFRESAFDDPADFYNTIHTNMPSLPEGNPKVTLPTILVGVRTVPHGTRQVFTTEAQDLARENGWDFVEVSTLDLSNIDETLAKIARLILAQRYLAGQPKQSGGCKQQDLESDQETDNSVKRRQHATKSSILEIRSQRAMKCSILQ
ncbi:Ras GTPase ras2 [Xylographa trunciseda]|nr:Ras GTPase ras2 [Xylographa trunciseda]